MPKHPFTSSGRPSTKTVSRAVRDLADLLKDVPVHVFVTMVAKAGLSAVDSRDLCRAFKGLK